MNDKSEIPEVERKIPETAVSLYESADAMDDFPVLKAFQQYIDAEQAKARKRLMMLCIFFGVMMFCVISVFVVLLMMVNSRNQALNDRLVDYAMRKLDSPGATAVMAHPAVVTQPQPVMAQPVMVQPQSVTPTVQMPQPVQDNSAFAALSDKITELQKKLASSDKPKAAEPAKPRETAEQLEIKRLNALLAAEKEKQAAEQERKRLAELEEYRRKHYPELYEKKVEKAPASELESKKKKAPEEVETDAHEELLREVGQILREGEAISYFDEEDEDEVKPQPPSPKVVPVSTPAPAPKEYSIPVDVQGSSSQWSIPND